MVVVPGHPGRGRRQGGQRRRVGGEPDQLGQQGGEAAGGGRPWGELVAAWHELLGRGGQGAERRRAGQGPRAGEAGRGQGGLDGHAAVQPRRRRPGLQHHRPAVGQAQAGHLRQVPGPEQHLHRLGVEPAAAPGHHAPVHAPRLHRR
ncbi:MAG: hypothetical protein ACJ782_17975, partial [Actinomycetota bacterium]